MPRVNIDLVEHGIPIGEEHFLAQSAAAAGLSPTVWSGRETNPPRLAARPPLMKCHTLGDRKERNRQNFDAIDRGASSSHNRRAAVFSRQAKTGRGGPGLQ